jgi:hypothetical protein
MPHLPPTHHETSKRDSLNETKIKQKQNKTIPNLNSNLAKSMTHHNQTKELTTWFLTLQIKGGSQYFERRKILQLHNPFEAKPGETVATSFEAKL